VKPENKAAPSASQQEAADPDDTASAWYSPWGWTSAFRTGATSTSTSDDPYGSKTDAELVKEEALFRSESHEEASPAADADAAPVSTPPELANPIATSAAWNSAGWASFFSTSRLLTTKSITARGERGENGIEVMNIDEDEDSASAAAMPTKPPPPEAPPSAQKEDKEMKPPSDETQTPLTTSNSAKRKVVGNVRTASPTPSNKSKKSVPPTPRPPNLVLPTFKDTFHNLPRSRPRPKETSASASLTSTLAGLVSSVFYGSVKGSDSLRSSKGKEKADPENDALEHFGKELPRAWTYTSESLPMKECLRVVVIGVHGWFPSEFVFFFVSSLQTFNGTICAPSGVNLSSTSALLVSWDEYCKLNDVLIIAILFEEGCSLNFGALSYIFDAHSYIGAQVLRFER